MERSNTTAFELRTTAEHLSLLLKLPIWIICVSCIICIGLWLVAVLIFTYWTIGRTSSKLTRLFANCCTSTDHRQSNTIQMAPTNPAGILQRDAILFAPFSMYSTMLIHDRRNLAIKASAIVHVFSLYLTHRLPRTTTRAASWFIGSEGKTVNTLVPKEYIIILTTHYCAPLIMRGNLA